MKHDPSSSLAQPRLPTTSQIDLAKFQQSSGSLKWLPVVASAFLRQLPQWREDFDAALASQNRTHQTDLLHKIKGACYAVAAYGAIDVITKAEVQQARGRPLAPARLLEQLALLEADLLAIVAQAPADAH